MTEEERQAARQRRKEYYEQLSPEEQRAYREKRIRARKIKKLKKMAVSAGVILLLILIGVIGVLNQKGCGQANTGKESSQGQADKEPEALPEGTLEAPDWVIEDFVQKKKEVRPGTALGTVSGIVIHGTGKPGTSAEARHDFLDNLTEGQETTAAPHFIVGIDGTIIQCIPLSETSAAVEGRQSDTVSIECCHIDSSGKFSTSTYQALVRLVQWLLESYDLSVDGVLMHGDVNDVQCPAYYLENPDAWNQLISDLAQ